MRVKLIFLSVVAAVLLSGCSMTAEEQRVADIQSCTDYGFSEGTDAFASCRQNLAQQRSADDRAMAVAFASRPLPVYQPPPPVQLWQPPPRVRMNCTSTGYGNMMTTNCY